jgi:hypothetical protein
MTEEEVQKRILAHRALKQQRQMNSIGNAHGQARVINGVWTYELLKDGVVINTMPIEVIKFNHCNYGLNGVALAIQTDAGWQIGWSLCHPKDKKLFNKNMAVTLACQKALSEFKKPVRGIRNTFESVLADVGWMHLAIA